MAFPLFDGPPLGECYNCRFQIMRSNPLPNRRLISTWHRNLILSLGVTAFVVGLVSLYFLYEAQRRQADKQNLFSSILSQLGRGSRKLSRLIRARKKKVAVEEDVGPAAPRPLSGMVAFRMLAHTGVMPASTPDSSLCILPISGPSPQKYWDGSYIPAWSGISTGRNTPGRMTPMSWISGTSTPLKDLSGATSPTRPGLSRGHSTHSSVGSEDALGPLKAPAAYASPKQRSSSFRPLNFLSNEAHVARPISASPSATTSVYEGRGPSRPSAASLYFGYHSFAQDKWDHTQAFHADILATDLIQLCLEQGFDGLVLLFDDSLQVTLVNDLLLRLQQAGIPVIFMAESDALVYDSLDFRHMDGVIIQNAHILRNGLRRDYFRAARLRDQAARAKRQQKDRPSFFFGFLEVWNQQPSAAVLRRAYKLADFFGAVIEARPANSSLPDRQKKEMPLSGFDYLKKMDVVWVQKQWSKEVEVECKPTKDSTAVKLDIAKINDILPAADQLLANKPLPLDIFATDATYKEEQNALDYALVAPRLSDFWNTSSCGATLCPLGCFELREEVVQEQYDELLRGQRHLKTLGMLHHMSIVELSATLDALSKLADLTAHPVLLSELRTGLKLGKVRIYKGLDSGFTLPDNGGHFWGLSDTICEGAETIIDIYLSQKNYMDAATIWHVFLAHNEVPRSIRFLEELHFVKGPPNEYGVELPKSIRRELEESTEAEMLYLLQQIKLASLRHPLADAMQTVCFKLLVEKSSRETWAETHSKACLDGSVTLRALFRMRLDYLREQGAVALPDVNNLLILYNSLDKRMAECLFTCNRGMLNRLLGILLQTYSTAMDGLKVDITTDLYALVFFCALRKYAFEDVYLETTDRCPYFLSQHDQAGVFSELWVLGSQCKIYFGILPRALGEIIFDKYRAYLQDNKPPVSAFNGKDVFTAYSNVTPLKKVEGLEPNARTGKTKDLPGDTPGHKLNEPTKNSKVKDIAHTLGALSIFCLPAITDVTLLTFLGRGFFLTAFMDAAAKKMGNFAILTALLMTGGITGWVGSTGGFYLFNYAFDNMTHFFIQRFAAAFAITTGVAVLGFIAFGFEYGWLAGILYVLYLYAMTTFLNLLGVLATMHRDGSPLTSGRITLWKCMSILFISPILTTFVNGHDLLIYMLVIYTFIFVLLYSFRNLCHEWTTWQAKVPAIKEKDLIAWFKEKIQDDEESESEADDNILAAEARELLQNEVYHYHHRSLYIKIFYRVADKFVEKMAVGHPYAIWLLEKEAGENELPEMYTATWFVQLELALGNQRQLGRGLREHSPFISFRYSKYDIGQNVGLFLAALMDRWVDLVMMARNHQPQLYISDRSRYGMCFGLLYFLFGAISVDVVLQRFWAKMSAMSEEKLSEVADFDRVKAQEAALRRKHYRDALASLFTFLSIAFGAMTMLFWAFQDKEIVPEGGAFTYQGTILYFIYIVAYTGVLVFQFNRCFTKDPRAHILTVFVCAAAGFVVGVTLRAIPRTSDWVYNEALALLVATVGSAVGTFWFTGYFAAPAERQTHVYKHMANKSSMDEKKITGLRSALTTRDGHAFAAATRCVDSHTLIRRMLKMLTLDIDVNVKWALLPEDVRRYIVCRVLGLPLQVTATVRTWLIEEGKNVDRYNNALAMAINDLREVVIARKDRDSVSSSSPSSAYPIDRQPELSAALPKTPRHTNFLVRAFESLVRGFHDGGKWIAIISGAGPDVPKELWYSLRANPCRPVVLWILLKLWKLCFWLKNFVIYIFLIAGKENYSKFRSMVNNGAPRTLEGHKVVVETASFTRTGFISRTNARNLVLHIFDGDLPAHPANKKPLARAFYGSTHRLHSREEATGEVITYTYDQLSHKRWPTSKIILENGVETRCLYDKFGRVKSGRIIRGKNEFSFEYVFSNRPKGSAEVLQANYSSVTGIAKFTMSVFFSIKPRAGSDEVKNWTPSEKVQRVILTADGTTFDVRWVYKHASHPEFETTVMSGGTTETVMVCPERVMKDEYGFLKKPKNVSFEDEDLLVHHQTRWIDRLCRPGHASSEDSLNGNVANKLSKQMPTRWSKSEKKVVYRRMASSQLRTLLWKSWGKAPFLDAVTACYLDEMVLRQEPLLRRYWHLRDAGHLLRASYALDENLEQVVSAIEPSVESSQTCPLYIKVSDLFEMGLSKDSNRLPARPDDAYRDTPTSTSVIFSDNGCWPDNPGGVSNCRRDLVNGHTTIRGHCLAEGANDYGVPRYQIERNINSLKVLPLWGLDGKTPYHGLLDNLLQTQIDERINDTRIEQDVKNIFVPLLKSFVRGARSRRYTREDLVTYSNVILKMNRYFETRDFNKTWKCEAVWDAWVEAWLMDYGDPNVNNVRDMMEIETPCMTDFRDALNLYICYFFIYSVEIPGDCPKVFQTTHHGISSLYGILLKYRRGTVWGIWDHAILWREMCLNISPAQCLLPIPVQSMLLAGVKLACHLAYTHADIILPCTSVFNPDWEMDLGTDGGHRGSKKLFARKIDPIVNGIGNMDAFQPVKETRTKFPTTVMLSNVQFIKDVKNAVLAADVIINKFGFQDYRLTVYGAQDRQPSYALETTTLINTRNMAGKVTLAGFGSPKEVLKDAWLFMNSSLSEGLPLAIGEAALSGIPIVATEVGATALVLTDPDDATKRYGEVVPPNDPEALARAQISLLAMLGPWTAYTHDETPPPPLPDTFTPEDVAWITKRMYEKQEDRKALGLKLRDVVLRSFHGKRYLREHEQMYWIQRKQAEFRRSGKQSRVHPGNGALFGETNLFRYDTNAESEQAIRPRWQDFDLTKLKDRNGKPVRKSKRLARSHYGALHSMP